MTDRVRITDVAPRDGLQAETDPVATARKAELVRAVQRTGVAEVEVSSFVSPKWIPQLGDAAELFGMLAADKPEGVQYSALVPNDRGFESALAVNRSARESHGIERLIDKVSVFTAASETFAQKNTNATIADTIERFRPIVPAAHSQGMRVRGYISCVVKCPFEGDIPPTAVAEVAAGMIRIGVDEIDLGDTIGGRRARLDRGGVDRGDRPAAWSSDQRLRGAHSDAAPARHLRACGGVRHAGARDRRPLVRRVVGRFGRMPVRVNPRASRAGEHRDVHACAHDRSLRSACRG